MDNKVTICLQSLFEAMAEDNVDVCDLDLQFGRVEKTTEGNTDYYDFKHRDGTTPCMDGETCRILQETEEYILLEEEDEKIPFKLALEEYKKATNSTLNYKVICYKKNGDRDHIEYSESLKEAKRIRKEWARKIGLKPEPSMDFPKYPTVWRLSFDNEYYRIMGL